MRLLVISPLFPPIANAEAFCSGLFVKALRKTDIDVQVITCSNVFRGAAVDDSGCWHELQSVMHDVPAPPRLSLAKRTALAARYQIVSWTAWTDAAVSVAERLHAASPFVAVMSRSIPTQAHYAGFWIARRLKLPWFVNINDPLDFSPFVTDPAFQSDWSVSLVERLWHQRILRRADLVTFPCERLRAHVLAGSSRVRPTGDIPHVAIPAKVAAVKDRFVIVHAGRLGKNELTSRSADAIIDGLARLLQKCPEKRHLIRLRFVGPTDSALRQEIVTRGLEDVVEQTGAVNYEESLKHISEATVCVLIEAPFTEGIFLPSKLCNYLVARKPVLALSPAIGTVADLAAQGGILRVDDAAAVTSALENLFQAYLAGALDKYQPPQALSESFRPENVTRQFFRTLGTCNPLHRAVTSPSLTGSPTPRTVERRG